MATNEEGTPQPPARAAVFIATHTATIPGTPLTAYVGRLDGAGPERAGVLLSDFTLALDGKRRRTLSNILGKFSAYGSFNLEEVCAKSVVTLSGEHSGNGSPQVLLDEGIASLAGHLMMLLAEKKLDGSARLRAAAAQLGLMQTRAATEGWRVAIFQAVGLNPHPQIEAPQPPAEVSDVERLRLEVEQTRITLEQDRFEAQRTSDRALRRVQNRERRAAAIEKARDDMYRNNSITAQQAAEMTRQAMTIRLGGRVPRSVQSAEQKPPPGWLSGTAVGLSFHPAGTPNAIRKIALELGLRKPGGGVPGQSMQVRLHLPDGGGAQPHWFYSPEAAQRCRSRYPAWLMASKSRLRDFNKRCTRQGLPHYDPEKS